MPNGRSAAVESYYPGRIRVRLPKEHRTEKAISEIRSLVADIDGIRNVYTNPVTGSVLVEYDPEAVDAQRMIALGRAASLIAGAGEAIAGGAEAVGWLGPSPSAKQVLEGMKRFDKGVHRMTRGLVDAKMAVPLLLLALSLGRAFLSQKRSPAPWHSLLWYSYSVFMQWNRPTGVSGTARAD